MTDSAADGCAAEASGGCGCMTACAESGPLAATSTGSAVHHAILIRKLLVPPLDC
ncbi:hypothetical protein [Sphingomonas sp.]|uniref:hypothetical protein n=1 Tax=Sphingomonas sp. TaxID=28214 RepID=UPI0025EAD0D2|nr:hypothetical protein [Sphingomonas sp.]MBV9528601.1 hypothetical protein [Sphingomonas sp.]